MSSLKDPCPSLPSPAECKAKPTAEPTSSYIFSCTRSLPGMRPILSLNARASPYSTLGRARIHYVVVVYQSVYVCNTLITHFWAKFIFL
jgi:hypothetical protein